MKGILLDNLINAEVKKEPFDHTTFQLFDKELCNKLIKNFYEINDYLTTKKGLSNSRFMVQIEGNTLDGIKYNDYPFLKNIHPLVDVLKVYTEKIIIEHYRKYYKLNKNCRFTLCLIYDKKNYSIGPHTDSIKRATTQITYLACDKDLDKNLGVSVYKDLINRHKDKWEKKHYTFENFEKVDQVEYYPGSSINFKVTPNSFHGVEKINEDCNRMSIQTVIWKD